MNALDPPAERLASVVCEATDARATRSTEEVQRLWSGYGQIVRCHLDGAAVPSVIVKHVQWPDRVEHPRGWTTGIGHERKLRSYQVETTWYERYAEQCPDSCRVPECLAVVSFDDGIIIVLEDLDATGLSGRRQCVDDADVDACVSWLANFHATFMHRRPVGLWETGTYWHLATRPEEFAALDDGPLKSAAVEIDERLAASPFQTLVHGDAKLANFCFGHDRQAVAAVDFQYVGGGCGMKDLAYFISSCFDEDECERLADGVLDRYFELLGPAVHRAHPGIDVEVLEADWRSLYAVAWADFTRFLQGWSPGHSKLHRYSAGLVRNVLESL